jgi:ribosome biogenesis protein ENP2
VDVKWHAPPGGGALGGGPTFIVSADRRAVKVWDAASGAGHTSFEPPEGADLNDVALSPGSGLVLAGADCGRIQAWYVPSLGPAPRWCSFLESLTEELEEAADPAVYDDYRFVTRPGLEELGLAHLVGTPAARAYMHGFFVDNRLYAKARAIADPLAYEAYRARKVEERLEAERASRISLARKLPKVNAAVAARLLQEREKEAERAARRAPAAAAAAAAARESVAAPEKQRSRRRRHRRRRRLATIACRPRRWLQLFRRMRHSRARSHLSSGII